MSKGLIDAATLREKFHYDPETGVFRRRLGSARTISDKQAGWIGDRRYMMILINGRNYRCHRLAWLYVYGEWPSKDLDHINQVKTDNRIANLREATYAVNNQNRPTYRNNTSGYRGVSWSKSCACWIAQITFDSKQRFLGRFQTKEEAYAAYLTAASVVHTDNPLIRQQGGCGS